MKGISFHKLVASGNDFLVIDNRRGLLKDPKDLARKACDRHTGVGADGLLLVENSRKAAFKMRIINSDGSEAEACGNGFRSIALYVKQQLRFRFPLKFESLAGLVEASFHGARVRVKLPDPKNFVAQETIHAKGHRLHYSFINTGVPHAVIFTEKLDGLDVAGIGAAIRYHRQFEPAGTNVNFVRVVSPSEIRVRTYERGVEAETLACGTGSTASALVSAYFRYAKPPVKVRTAGGEVLTVDFRWAGEKAEKVFLEGEARFVCEGKFYL